MKDILNLKYGLGKNTVVPYVIARSSIFSSQIYRGPCQRPEAATPIQITALGTFGITQVAGHRLDQSDAEVFYEIIRTLFSKIRSSAVNLQVEIERSNLLSSIGRAKGGKTNKSLNDSLTRLVNAKFWVHEANNSHRTMGILQSFDFHSKSTRKSILIEIDPTLVDLYLDNQWAILKNTERAQLISPIAQALYAYYCTHKEPHPLKTTTIKMLVGRKETQETRWLAQLQIALDEIKKATGWRVCEVAKSGKYIGKVVVAKKAAEQGSQRRAFLKPEHNIVEIKDDYGI